MQRLDVSGAVRPIYGSLGVKRLMCLRAKTQKGFLSLIDDVQLTSADGDVRCTSAHG